jgi:hypothetical protein
MTREEFGKIIGGLAIVYEKELVPQLIDIYYSIFKQFTKEEFNRAANMHSKTGSYWPKPADLMKYLQPDPESAATLAFAEMKRLVAKYGPYETLIFDGEAALLGQIILRLGGWQKLCNMNVEEFGYQFHKDFVTMYKAMCHGSYEPVRFIGITELENNRTGRIGAFETYHISGLAEDDVKKIAASAPDVKEVKRIAAPKSEYVQMIGKLREKLAMEGEANG